MADYLPKREADFLAWAETFGTKITATPTVFGLTAAQATSYMTLFGAFESAFRTCRNEGSRTPVAIGEKKDAKDALIDGPGGIRKLVGIVQKAPGTTDPMRIDLGITVPDPATPIPAPTDSPEIDFTPTATRIVRVRLHNENTLHRKRPEGVKGAALFYHVGPTAPTEWKDWTFCENTTRTTVEIDLGASVPSGSTVWFTAQWFNPRMETGPATTPVSTVVQYGGLSMAA